MHENLFDLSGRITLVTGAARGLGKAAALGLAAFGADVAAVDLDRQRCTATVEAIAALGRRAAAYGCAWRWTTRRGTPSWPPRAAWAVFPASLWGAPSDRPSTC